MSLFNNKLRDTYIYLLILIVFSIILFVPSTLDRDLHYRDELRYTEVAREMENSGDYFVPQLGGRNYTDKPPFYFWFLILTKKIFGEYSASAMVSPSIISAIIIILLTFYFARSFLEEKYAFLAGIILATTVLFFSLSIFVRMDLLMMVFITAALFTFFKAYQNQKDYLYFLTYLFIGFATAIKGPAGFLIPLITILGFLIWDNKLEKLKEIKLVQGLIIFLSVILLWLIPAFIFGGKEYIYELLVLQTFGRAVNSFAHSEPFYYYFTTLPLTLLPWTFLLISSFFYIIKYYRNINPELKFILSWFFWPLLLFSIFSGKLVFYLLPIYPAASILIAYLCQQIIVNQDNKKFIVIPVLLTIIVIIAGSFFIPANIEGYNLRNLLKPTIIASVFILLAAAALYFKNKYLSLIYLLPALMLIFSLNLSLVIVPTASQSYSKRPIGEELKELREKENIENIAAFRYGQPETLAVYTDFFIKDLGNEETLINYLQEKQEAVILVRDSDLKRIRDIFVQKKVIYHSNGYNLVYHLVE
ncbi:4-amino-4-deoxy-L-arabinose transferase-like glycosyltransferase [Halanaerobium saccharolyticum]|uniref:4-amino-4-deoxy-L-arabinose transferase-like glycosyltransferase n=1 Tax=Halanaerobium saccharolyticum TaxID=43595 RepID=A0A4R6M4E4_9FIRM|nr:glycosyltransferase family 39 protein [Halanaerobium saccharolyticum]TDO94809.1 4-amino-4-deoxy-L-arabinose transferase-like glycosyltransferase [Halanaerobium saccharolyticum]